MLLVLLLLVMVVLLNSSHLVEWFSWASTTAARENAAPLRRAPVRRRGDVAHDFLVTFPW
jgi:hypothetical protein